MYYAGSFGPKRLLNDELRQLDEEGFVISDDLKNEALQFEDDSSFEKFQAFYDKLKKLPKKPDFNFYEPNSLSDILDARPAKRMAPKTFSNDFDTLYAPSTIALYPRTVFLYCIALSGAKFSP